MAPSDDAWPEEIRYRLGRLTDFERRILFMRYGLDQGEPRTLEEVGEALGLSRQEVRAIEERAFQLLTNAGPARGEHPAGLFEEPATGRWLSPRPGRQRKR